MANETNNRVFIGWNNGAFVTTLDPEFQAHLDELVARYGPPDVVEFRSGEDDNETD